MVNVVFVGDRAAASNVSNDVAFVGAKCFNTLVKWIKVLDPDYYVCYNSIDTTDIGNILMLYHAGFKVVALGVNASKRLDTINVSHHKCDHPSGLNRKLNSKKYVDNMLKECYNYIREKQ